MKAAPHIKIKKAGEVLLQSVKAYNLLPLIWMLSHTGIKQLLVFTELQQHPSKRRSTAWRVPTVDNVPNERGGFAS